MSRANTIVVEMQVNGCGDNTGTAEMEMEVEVEVEVEVLDLEAANHTMTTRISPLTR